MKISGSNIKNKNELWLCVGMVWYSLEYIGSLSISSMYKSVCMSPYVKITPFIAKYGALKKKPVQGKNNYWRVNAKVGDAFFHFRLSKILIQPCTYNTHNTNNLN